MIIVAATVAHGHRTLVLGHEPLDDVLGVAAVLAFLAPDHAHCDVH